MRRVLHATDSNYRQAIANERNHGRLPLAWLTFGNITGRGWGFLHPWAQQAIFPTKGTPAAFQSPERGHEVFILVRIYAVREWHRHRNHDQWIRGRYWRGFAWRRSWRWPRWVLLDPDIITGYDSVRYIEL